MMRSPVRWVILLNLVLLVSLAQLWLDRDGQWKQPVWSAPTPVPPTVINASLRMAEPTPLEPAAAVMLSERPLFFPTRKPLPVKSTQAPPPPDALDLTVINGLVTSGAGWVLATVEGQPRRISVGQRVGDWELKSVDRQEATFVRDGTTRVLALAKIALGARRATAGGGAVAVAPPVSAGRPATGSAAMEAGRDEQREILRRRNELRAQRGLPPLSQ